MAQTATSIEALISVLEAGLIPPLHHLLGPLPARTRGWPLARTKGWESLARTTGCRPFARLRGWQALARIRGWESFSRTVKGPLMAETVSSELLARPILGSGMTKTVGSEQPLAKTAWGLETPDYRGSSFLALQALRTVVLV